MNDLKLIYRILKILENAMDSDEFDAESISAERLKISENRLENSAIAKVAHAVKGVSDTATHFIP